MEISHEEAESMLHKRLDQYPQIKSLITANTFKDSLSKIATFERIDPALVPAIEHEVLVVLAFYAPLSALAANITESTKLPLEASMKLVTMIETILLESVHTELAAFEYLWNTELTKNSPLPAASKDLKEKLELRPKETSVANISRVMPTTPTAAASSIQAKSNPLFATLEKINTVKQAPVTPTPTQPTTPVTIAPVTLEKASEQTVVPTTIVTAPQEKTPEQVVQTGPKPLTREEVLEALTPRRTMASDMQTIAGKEKQAPIAAVPSLA